MTIEAKELVAEAVRICGSRSELAHRLKIPYGEDRIGTWLRGGSPRYEQAIELLEIVGWLDDDAISRDRAARAEARDAEEAAEEAARAADEALEESGTQDQPQRAEEDTPP